MAELLQKGTALIDDASGTINTVSGKLTNALDAMTITVNNANDLVVGLKQGRGAIGMLLQDEKTADAIWQSIASVRDATASLNHASVETDALVSDFRSRELGAKVDAIVSDLQSRNLGEKLDQTVTSVQSATRSIDETTQQLQSAVAKALSPDGEGRDAADNIRETLSNVNEATANMADDTEALKHEFFFRGFFRKRGYYSLERLDPEKYRQDKVFSNSKNTRTWIEAAELFDLRQGEPETLSRAGKQRIDAAVAELGNPALGGVIVVEGYAVSRVPGEDMAISRTRAILVRNYLHNRFQIDSQNIGVVPLRGVPPPATRKESWNGICLVLLSQRAG